MKEISGKLQQIRAESVANHLTGQHVYGDDQYSWQKCFVLLPHRCYITGKLLWLSEHFKLTITNQIYKTLEIKWISSEAEMLIRIMM